MNLPELSRLVANLIRIGTVHEVDLSAPRCRVASGELITDWLRMPSRRAGRTRKWDPLTIGEQVMIISPSGVIEGGFVIPMGIFSDAITPPSNSGDVEMTQYTDGETMSYNHATSELTISGIKMLNISASADVIITNDGDAVVTCGGAANITATGKASITGNHIELNGGGELDPVVTQQCICSMTGLSHPMASATVKASL
jgi:phage baseplate assembly protein V